MTIDETVIKPMQRYKIFFEYQRISFTNIIINN